MGLFDALPPLVSSAKVKVKEDVDDDDETRHTEKKRKIGDDDEEKLKVEVVVKSSVSSMDDRLEKLSKHVEKKFSTCTRAFLELVSKPEHASALERKHGKKILLVMRRAMATHFPQSSEEYLLSFSSKKETATIFCNLFDAIEELRENGIVGKNVKVTAEMIAWELYCRTMREIAASEDSFTLNASTKRLRKAFEEAPKRKKRRRLRRRFGGRNETKIRNGNRGKRTHSKRRERGGFEVRSASFGGGNSLGENWKKCTRKSAKL